MAECAKITLPKEVKLRTEERVGEEKRKVVLEKGNATRRGPGEEEEFK